MNWLDRVQRRVVTMERRSKPRPRKGFVMPPFWSQGDGYGGGRVAISAASYGPDRESVGDGFEAYIRDMYKANGIVFACTVARARVFSQARLTFQRMRGGRPGDLFGNDTLRLLERPWLHGNTAMLLTNMEIDASLAGNYFSVIVDSNGRIGNAHDPRDPQRFISRMRPDWITLVIGAPSGNPFNVDARVVALSYAAPGMTGDPLILTRDEFVHYAPLPDPDARFRGMTWMTPVIRDVSADNAFTDHKIAFLKNGATPNLVVKFGDDIDEDEFRDFVDQFRRDYEGIANAYKTLFLAGGADVTPLNINFQELELKSAQGSLETRIAADAGVHPAIAGLSEGLQGSSLNEGNFKAARRLFVDSTIRDLWGKAAPALEVHAPPPDATTRLWYDARDVPFLREDAGDEATTFAAQVGAVRQGIEAGYEPDAMVMAAAVSDVRLMLGKHTGLTSVQLRPAAESVTPSSTRSSEATMPTLEITPNGNRRPLATVEG